MKRHIDLSLYLITRRGQLTLDTFLHVIHEAVTGGVTAVQLREKECSTDEMIAVARELKTLLKPLGIPLLINDRIEVALAMQADGVHLGQKDLSVKAARSLLGRGAFIGLSTGNQDEVRAAAEEEVDYLGFGPLFHTDSKAYLGKPRGLGALQEVCSISAHPVVAVGGMNETNVKEALDRGAAGIAVVSYIFNAPSPASAARTLIEGMRR